MPLCWAHAEYLTLVRSRKDGIGFDCVPPVRRRYIEQREASKTEIWTLAHQPRCIRRGKILRIILGSQATVQWTADNWGTRNKLSTQDSCLDCWFADLPTQEYPVGTRILFTFISQSVPQEREFSVEIA